MKRLLAFALITLSLHHAADASLIVTNFVAPAGDGHSGKSRWGYSAWYNDGYTGTTPTVSAFHWYEYGDGESYNAFVQISLSGIENADQIESATLNIYLPSASTDITYLQFVDQSATLATGDASQQLGGATIENIGVVPGGWLSLDVTAEVQSDVASGRSFTAFKFANSGDSSLSFSSADNADTNQHPFLAVTIPEPASISLIGMAGGGFLAVRRLSRRKKHEG